MGRKWSVLRCKNSEPRMSAAGRVSRGSPVQTAMRNCTRDEGRSFEAGSQVLASNRCKLLSSERWPVACAMQHGGLLWVKTRIYRIATLTPASTSISRPQQRGFNAALCAMCGRPGLARKIFTSHRWSVQPCVRPVCAVHMTAGHNALRGSGPGQNLAFDNALALMGCPDRRIDRLCITCCSPSQPSHHAGYRRDLIHAASATGSL
jgi:hypothetical protein